MSISVRRVVAATASVGLAAIGLQLVGMAPALAHDAGVVGHATCASNGTYTVVWTITNTRTALDEEATISKLTPSSSTVSNTQVSIGANKSKSVTQSNIPGTATTAGLNVFSKWTDNFQEDNLASTSLGGNCNTTSVRTAPTADNGACVDYKATRPSVSIPSIKGISWRLDGKGVGSGTRTVSAGTHEVTARSSSSTLTGRTSWTFKLSTASGNCGRPVKPASPDVSQAACTGTGPSAPRLILPDTKGIDYDVSKKAPYSAGQNVKVTANAKRGYKIGKVSSAWDKSGDAERATRTVRFDEAPVCSGFADENDTNSPGGAGYAAGSDVNNGGLAATGTDDFGPLAAIALVMLAMGMVLVRRTRRA